MNGDPPNLETTDARQLYLGSLPKQSSQYAEGFVGVCLDPKHDREIQHDLASPLPLSDSVIEQIQAEDVLEHIDLDCVPSLLSEIWRVLTPRGRFRLSVPDYRSPVLKARSVYDQHGKVICDTLMGGKIKYDPDSASTSVRFPPGGHTHLWFPTYELVTEAILKSDLRLCRRIDWHHYWRADSDWVARPFDMGVMPVKRCPPVDMRADGKPISIIVDFEK